MHLPDPTFPPLLSGHALKGAPRPLECARTRAAAGEAGAGDLFWSRSTSEFDVAVVLEPEVAAEQALQMLFAAMVAFGDAVGALAPPEVGLFYRWPGDLLVNGAKVGTAVAALPPGIGRDEVPDWLVVGISARMRSDPRQTDPGYDTDNTSLDLEGCGDITRTDLVESFARHFLVWIHTWQEDGFGAIHQAWVGRAADMEEGPGAQQGAMVGLDDLGNLLVRGDGGTTEARDLMRHVVGTGGEGTR